MNRFAPHSLLLLLLFIVCPAMAQNGAFLEKLMVHIQAGDFQGMIAEVQADPVQAVQSVKVLAEQAAQSKDPEERKAVVFYANVLARILKLHCNQPGLMDELSKSGQLLPAETWVGTPLAEAASSPAPETGNSQLSHFLNRFQTVTATMATTMEQMQKDAAELPVVMDRANFAAYVEDMQALAQVLEFFYKPLSPQLAKAVEELRALSVEAAQLGAGSEPLLRSLETFSQSLKRRELTNEVMKVRILGARGFYGESLREGERLLPQVSDPELKNQLLIALVNASLETGQLKKAEQYRAQATARKKDDELTFGTSQLVIGYQLNPVETARNFVPRFQNLWSVATSLKGGDLSRPAAQSAQDLVTLADEIARSLPQSDPERKTLISLQDKSLSDLERLGRESVEKPPREQERLNPEWITFYYFHHLLTRLELARQAREGDDMAASQRHLAKVEASLRELAELKARLQPVGQELFRDSGIELSLDRGFFSHIPARYHEEMGHNTSWNSRPLTKESAARVKASYEKAIELYNLSGNSHGELMSLLPKYALVAHTAGGDAKDSLELIDESLRNSQKRGIRRSSIEALLARGELLARLNREKEATDALKKGLTEVEDFVVEFGARAPASLSLKESAEPAYQRLARLQAKNDSPQEVLSVLGRLAQMKSQATVVPSVAGDSKLGAALEKVRRGQIRLRSLQSEGEALRASAPDSLKTVAVEANTKLLASTKAEFYNSLGVLYRINPSFERLAIRPVNFGRVQKYVPKNTLVAQYFPTEDVLYIFLLDQTSLKTRQVAVKESELARLGGKFRRSLCRVGDIEEESLALYRYLIAPIEEELQGKEVLAVVPTGSLLYVPFQALARSGADGTPEYLIERFQTVSLVKSSDLDILDNEVSRGSQGKLVAFGNPDGSLMSALLEVKALQDLFPNASVFTGEKARKSALQNLGNQGVSYLHFATHGILDSEDPRANHLVLAGSGQDAQLAVSEIAGLDLGQDIRLVTLSACQTALVNDSPRSELLQSMADAFGYAGSPSVVASLWSVSDESTRLLMEEFYSELKNGSTRARALQKAGLKVAHTEKFKHPFYWAPFVLMGDWR